MKKSLLIIIGLAMTSLTIQAQEDITGNWLMYFGTNKITDDLSIHTEAQYRNHTVEPVNIEQLLLRTGLNYHHKSGAIFTMGYGYIASHDYESPQVAPESREHRIFQQLILKNKVSRLNFEHRYRVEQRWVNSDYRSRLRYRLMATLPLNKSNMDEGTWFLSAYNELFVNTKQIYFDRNRLYGAVGYQLKPNIQCSTTVCPPRYEKTEAKVHDPTNNQQTIAVVFAVKNTDCFKPSNVNDL